ncbi:BOS complex subunit NCLN-like [Latimeria chalumnae]|uniref:BOS complex subunit NCLN-like n=1 Tax=Latimeria chalumnae TaxID=7897 RepID=UPI00313F3A1F
MSKSPGSPTALVFVPAVLVVLVLVPVQPYEFTVYRMQQFNLQGQRYGCRNALVHAEARTLEAGVLTRRCVIIRLVDLTLERFREALRQSAAAVLILLPHNISATTQDLVQHFMEIEPELLLTETNVPVYFTHEQKDILTIYEESKAASLALQSSSALEVLVSMVVASGFHMETSEIQSKAQTDSIIITLEGYLPGQGEDLPTVVIVAHYDAFGVVPWLSHGADSNGSGVAILLELVRVFQKLYSDKSTLPRYNILFSLTGGGKFNYQGSKYWLEDQLDHSESSLLFDNVAFVLCLDTLGNGDALHLHVSRLPREGTPQWDFMKELETVASARFSDVKFSVVHKKVNLAEEMLAWEHERFVLRRVPAFTLSHLDHHNSSRRSSIMDTSSQLDIKRLHRNTVIIAESITRFLYGLSEKGFPRELQVFKGRLEVEESRLAALIGWLASQPRAAQLLEKDHSVVSTMEYLFNRHLKDVRCHIFKADKREPEFVFYDQLKQTMIAYRILATCTPESSD